MVTPKLKKSVWVVLTAAALTACGGGGGGSSSSSSSSSDSDNSSQPLVVGMKDKSEYADKFDATINNFTCFKGENKDKCGLILYQVMVEAAPDGGDVAEVKRKGIGWGPSEHRGTLKGIENSLDFIKGSGANALWITPVFTASTTGNDIVSKTSATGYYASKYWEGDWEGGNASIDPNFGDFVSFQSLVDTTHDKNMLFILDGVFGHAKSDINSPLDNVRSSKCFKADGSTENLETDSFKTCFDWGNGVTKTFFEKLAENMITKYKIDGWRLDQAYQVPNGDWSNISRAVKVKAAATSGRPGAGYMVAEVWSGKEDIKRSVFGTAEAKDGDAEAAVESAFNFPLRYKLVQVLAGQEDEQKDKKVEEREATMMSASFIANDWGYGSLDEYKPYYNVMPNMFTDNHDLVRFGNLLFRHNILDIKSAEPLLEDDVGVPEYSQRHLLAFAFMMEYSGPITIYYGSEYGDWTRGYSTQPTDCGSGDKWCDDHASRTQMVSSEDKLKQWQKDLRTNVGKMMEYRKEHPALYNGNRFHIYSTTKKPADRDSANFYVDVKKATDGSEAFVFVASMSRKDRTLQFDDEMAKYLCQKAKGADSCDLDLVMDTSKPDVMSTVQDSSKFAFEMPALSARLYKVE